MDFLYLIGISSGPSSTVTAFCWKTLTHLSANLNLCRRDWYLILEQCVNLSFGSISLVLTEEWSQPFINDRGVVHHRNFKMLSIRGTPQHLEVALNGFLFPSLIALRICCTQLPRSLGTIHQLLNTTPALKELHLQSCIPFSFSNFLCQSQTPTLIGALSKFAPHLLTLVIDGVGHIFSVPQELLILLHSDWLNEGWSHSSDLQRSVEFIVLDKDQRCSTSLIDSLIGEINPTVALTFRVSGRYVQGGLWTWQQPTSADLKDRWDDLLGFYYCVDDL